MFSFERRDYGVSDFIQDQDDTVEGSKSNEGKSSQGAAGRDIRAFKRVIWQETKLSRTLSLPIVDGDPSPPHPPPRGPSPFLQPTPRQGLRPPGRPPPPGGFQHAPRQPVQSTRVIGKDRYRKMLTNYEAYTIRKVAPRDSKEKSTWAKSDVTKEPLSQEDISRAVKKLNESKRSVQDKKATLVQFQQGQINRLMDELMSRDNDPNFEWSLSQIDQRTFTNKKGQKETLTITVYVKHAPLKDVDPIGIFNAIERNKQERLKGLEQMNRPPPPRPEPASKGEGADP